ncbi:MAG: hypothetical protein IKV15_00795 [Bacteroidaceae bacterium]|nr:hypothetical protein [Bacteroidaceae bacterium]
MVKLFEKIGSDGAMRIILLSAFVVVLNLFLPTWAAVLIAAAVGAGKEVYDYKTGKGKPQVKDIACDIVGLLIGVL